MNTNFTYIPGRRNSFIENVGFWLYVVFTGEVCGKQFIILCLQVNFSPVLKLSAGFYLYYRYQNWGFSEAL